MKEIKLNTLFKVNLWDICGQECLVKLVAIDENNGSLSCVLLTEIKGDVSSYKYLIARVRKDGARISRTPTFNLI